jgi:hypothetical protein
MRLFRRRTITEHTDLEALSSKRLLREHRRQVAASADPRAGGLTGDSFWISASIEEELDRRGVPYPTAKEILGEDQEGDRA